jgi:hypothetical protein
MKRIFMFIVCHYYFNLAFNLLLVITFNFHLRLNYFINYFQINCFYYFSSFSWFFIRQLIFYFYLTFSIFNAFFHLLFILTIAKMNMISFFYYYYYYCFFYCFYLFFVLPLFSSYCHLYYVSYFLFYYLI